MDVINRLAEMFYKRDVIDDVIADIKNKDYQKAYSRLLEDAQKNGWQVVENSDIESIDKSGFFTLKGGKKITLANSYDTPQLKLAALAHEYIIGQAVEKAQKAPDPVAYLNHNFHKALKRDFELHSELPDYPKKNGRLSFMALALKRAQVNPKILSKEFDRLLSK